MMVALTVAGLILFNIGMVMRASGGAYESGVFLGNLEDQNDRTMDRIVLALMSTSSAKLDEVQKAPGYVSAIEYEVIVDVDGGNAIEGVPERIEFEGQQGAVVWTRAPGTPENQSAVWTRWVPQLLEGETPNGEDDNGNGLTDEQGLSFNKVNADSDLVEVRLTLEREDSNNVLYTRTRGRQVTCRN